MPRARTDRSPTDRSPTPYSTRGTGTWSLKRPRRAMTRSARQTLRLFAAFGVGAPFAIAVAALGLLPGCEKGPIPTPGAENQPVERMALLHVTQHGGLHEWNGNAVHIDQFFVGGVGYAVTGDKPEEQKPFLVTPGPHTFMIDYGRCVHGWAGHPDDSLFSGPFGRFEATVEAGGEYVLVAENKLAGTNPIQTLHRLKRVDAGAVDESASPETRPTTPVPATTPSATQPAATQPTASRPTTVGL